MEIIFVCCICQNTNEKMSKCGICHQAHYCSKECQRKDWPRHKILCSPKLYKEVKYERNILHKILGNQLFHEKLYTLTYFWELMKPKNKSIYCLITINKKYSYIKPNDTLYFCKFFYGDENPKFFKDGISLVLVYAGICDKEEGLTSVINFDKMLSLGWYNILNFDNYYKDYKLPLTFIVNTENYCSIFKDGLIIVC